MTPGCAGAGAHRIQGPTNFAHPLGFTDAQCQALLSQRRTFGALGAGAAVVGGGSGLSAAFPIDNNWRYAVGGTSIGMSILSATFAYLANSTNEDFSRFCTTDPVASGSP